MTERRKPDIHALFGGANLPAIDRSIANLIDHPTTSHWLRDALSVAITRDPLDALADAETLVEMLTLRFNATMLEHGHMRFDHPD